MGFWYKIIILLLEIVIIIFYYLFQRYVASLSGSLSKKTSSSLVPCGVHIKPLEREEWTNVVSSFKVALVDLKTTSTDDLQGPLSASYVPGSCIKLILFDRETWSTWNHQPLPFLPRGRKNRKEKDFSYWTQSLARLQIWSGAQDWMYRDISQLNCTWSNGWFQCNSINLIFFFFW